MDRPFIKIDECMSPSPVTVPQSATLVEAESLMTRYNIRHLPVMDGDTLAGVISLRDVQVVKATPEVDHATVTVGQVAVAHVYSVQVGTGLREVAAMMGGHKYGSVIVLDGAKVVGVFTTVDALRVLLNVLG
jgi:acetoin utilization protein AcuB